MKNRWNLIKLLPLLFIIINPFAKAETFMTEQEMLKTFSGATLSGISTYDNSTRWTQIYEKFEQGKTEGIIIGDFGGKPYDSKWFIKANKWCENWDSGNGCYDLVRVDEKTIRAYEKGTPLVKLWEIQ